MGSESSKVNYSVPITKNIKDSGFSSVYRHPKYVKALITKPVGTKFTTL